MPEATLLHSALDDLREDPDRLIEIILKQAQQIEQLQGQLEALEHANEQLQKQLQEARREGKRQAAPFRRATEERAQAAKAPGRRAGHRASYRRRTAPIDEHVEVPLRGCPHCGGCVDQVRPIRQVIEEIPPVTPTVFEVVTYRGRCPHCGPVETRHPLQTSRATGAASVHLGPRAQAVALTLVYRHGLTLRRACATLEDFFGLRLSPGGLTQLAHRRSADLQEHEQVLLQAARAASVQYVDETSWWVSQAAKSQQWLWVFANREQTLYRVAAQRNRAVLEQVLGPSFEGVLVSDCLNIYDALAGEVLSLKAVQQKCYAHHLKALSEAQACYRALHQGDASSYLHRVRALLRAALALKAVQGALAPERSGSARCALEAQADRLLASGRADPQEDKVRQRLKKQRRHLFVFLDHEQVTATNNLAERRLRPAVIRRKLSCGNRSERGARTWERLASVMQTCVQQRRSVLEFMRQTASRTLAPEPLR